MSRHRWAILAVLIALPALLMPGMGAADETRIIQLKHRNAADLMPMIRPLLGPDDALSGMDYRLSLRTSDRNLHDIERLLAQLDVDQRRLRITVQQTVAEDQATASQSVTGETPVVTRGELCCPPIHPTRAALSYKRTISDTRQTGARRQAWVEIPKLSWPWMGNAPTSVLASRFPLCKKSWHSARTRPPLHRALRFRT